MSVQVTNTPIFLPEVPDKMDPLVRDYLQRLRLVIQQSLQGAFSNSSIVASAINSGTGGTFAIASGGHITLVNGIVTLVSTT